MSVDVFNRLSAVVHSEIFWGFAERRWTQEQDWRTSIRWPSTSRWVVTSMSWWVKVIPALSSSLLHHPSSLLLLRWALTASEVCGVTSQLWRRWSSSRFSTPKSLTTSRSSRPGLYITYIHVYLLHKLFILHTPGSIPGVNNKTSPIYWCTRTIIFLFCDG